MWPLLSWFAVHPVSMNNSNHLVNSDNVGYASYLFEQEKNKGMLPGEVGVPQGMAGTGLGQGRGELGQQGKGRNK